MSSMYEEVVVDVNKLRDQAKRYGQNALFEQFAPKINEAISSILEQDPFEEPEDVGAAEPPGLEPEAGDAEMGALDTGLGDEMGVGGDDPAMESELADDLPLAALEGENQMPGEDEEIEIDFDALMKDPEVGRDIHDGPPQLEEPENMYEGLAEKLDEIDLNELEETLDELAEELEVDFEPVKTGWGNTPAPELDHIADQHLASQMDDERKAEFKKTKKAVDSLQKENKRIKSEKALLEKKLSIYNKKIDKFKAIAVKQQTQLRSLSTSNSRLLYVNKVLTNESLNGVQKKQIASSIAKAKTPEEAKLIFETLQSNVGSQTRKPKSLSEVAKNSPQNYVVKAEMQKQQTDNGSIIDESVKRHMQKLAGIKK